MGFARAYRISPRLAFRVWQREATLYRRIWPSTILSNLFDPLLYLVAMGFGLGSYVADRVGGVPYLHFLAPGLVGSALMMAAAYEVSWNAYGRIHVERTYEAMMTTPATLEDVVAGELLWATTRSVIYASVMLVVLLGFGLLRSPWALAIPLVAVGGGLLFAILGLSYTSLVRHIDQITFFFTLFITPLFLFSGVFFPLEGLPTAARVAANLSPLYHVVEAVRDLALGTVGVDTSVHFAVVLLAALVVYPLPVAVLRRKLLA